MRILILSIAIMVLADCFICGERGASQTAAFLSEDTSQPAAALQPNTLCDRNERVIFSCPVTACEDRFRLRVEGPHPRTWIFAVRRLVSVIRPPGGRSALRLSAIY